MSTCQLTRHSVEFEVRNTEFAEREIACRLAMLGGTSGPLSWDEGPGLPAKMDQTQYGHSWFLGNGFTLVKTGSTTYQLSHASAKVEALREFLEWIFESQYR